MATTFFRRLAKGIPASFNNAFGGKPKSGSALFLFSVIVAVPGGIFTYYYVSESNLVHLGQIYEETGPKVALTSDKWPVFKLQDTAMIAGGTDKILVLQVIEAILKNPDDNTQVSLLYANVSLDDILLRQKLDVLAASHPNLKLFYTIDNPSKNWKGGAGYVSKDLVTKGLPGPGEDTIILVCGPR